MVKSIAISSCGIGFGHASRDKAIYDALKSKFKTKIYSYGEGFEFLKKNGVDVKNFSGISYKKQIYSLNIFSEVMRNLASLGKIYKGYNDFADELDKDAPNLIITDSEPFAYFYAYKRKIPIIVMTNVLSTAANYPALPKKLKTRGLALQNIALKTYIELTNTKRSTFVEPSIDKKHPKVINLKYSDLIVRKKPEEVKQINSGKEFYYTSVGSATEDALIENIKKVLPKFKDKFFVIVADKIKKEIHGDNFILLPFLKDPFPYIKGCSGIISPAGYTIISEALVYGKPILAVPVKNHLEQVVNAFLVEKQGFGLACYDAANLEKSMREFFSRLPKFEDNIKKAGFKGDGAEDVAKLVSKMLE